MEVVIGNQQDRCKLIHEIVSAPVGSIIVITTHLVGPDEVTGSNVDNKLVQLNAQQSM